MARHKNKLKITKFIHISLKQELSMQLPKVKFIEPIEEKSFYLRGLWKRPYFDLWSKKYGKKTPFAIWEVEIKQSWARNNILKVERILNWHWKPKIAFFHVFSPALYRITKEGCKKEAKRLMKKYKSRFVYNQIEIKIPKVRFNKITENFENNIYYAKRYYGKELEKETKRIARESVNILKRISFCQ